MALAQYTTTLWFPTGTLAAGVAVRIFPLNSNVLASLFSDAAGLIPLSNPFPAGNNGVVTFYAEAGEYWLHADTESFHIGVGVPEVTPAEIAALQADVAALEADMAAAQAAITALQAALVIVDDVAAASISTGTVAGGELSVNGISSSALDIGPLTGYFTDFSTDPFNPSIVRLDYPGTTVEMDAGSLSRTATAWLMDVDQNIIQQASPPTNTQRRTHIFLGATAQVGGNIIVDQSLPVIMHQPANQLTDLMTALGAFNISGNVVTPNGANLRINQSAGQIFSQAFNYFAGPIQTNDPHVADTMAQTPASFRYITRNGLMFGPLTNVIDVANYDNAGVVTPIGGGANSSTIHRVYLFANNDPSNQLVVHYGQTVYSSLTNAVNAIGSATFVPNPLMRAAALIGYIACTRVATNLSDPVQATIVTAGKFATP